MLDKIINGDKKAFDIFYKKYVERVYNYFYSKTQSAFYSEELTQLTFIKFWDYKYSLSETLPIEIQLFHKARLVFIDWLRKEATQRKLISGVANEFTNVEDSAMPTENEKYHKTSLALEQLPAARKKVVTLFYIEGYSYKEIATLLGISTKTVDNHIRQAITQLRKILTIFFNIFF